MDESPAEFLRRAGIQTKPSGRGNVRFPCPFCGDAEGFDMNTANGLWQCKRASCGEKGNLYALKTKMGYAYPVKSAGKSQSPEEQARDELAAAFANRPRIGSQVDGWCRALRDAPEAEAARAYLAGRGLTPATLGAAHVGWMAYNSEGKRGRPNAVNGAVTIPAFAQGSADPMMVKLRFVPPEPVQVNEAGKSRTIRYMRVAGGESVIYAPFGIDPTRTLMLVGGELDALSVAQVMLQGEARPNVASVPTGEGTWKDLWTAQLEACEDVVVVYDSDAAGVKGAERVAAALGGHRVRVGKWPGSGKDANAALVQGDLTPESLQGIVQGARSPVTDNVRTPDDMIEGVIADLRSTENVGWPTGWVPLDTMIGGWRRGEVTAVTGDTGCGKTTLVSQAGLFQALAGKRTLFVALEEGGKRLLRKLLRQHLRGDPAKASDDAIRAASKRLSASNACLIFDHYGAIDPEVMRETLLYVINRLGVEFVVFDHIDFAIQRGKEEWEAKDKFVMMLQKTISQTAAHCLVVTHPGKNSGDSRNRDDRIVQLGDVKGHSTLVQDFANVVSVYRPRKTDRSMEFDPHGNTSAALVVLKQRSEYGQEGTVALKFNAEQALFFSEEDGGIPAEPDFDPDPPKRRRPTPAQPPVQVSPSVPMHTAPAKPSVPAKAPAPAPVKNWWDD